MILGVIASQPLLLFGGGAIEEPPSSIEPIALIDFANENYLYFGSTVAVTDLLTEDEANWGQFDVINIIAGLGLKHPPASPGFNGSHPVFKDPLLSLMLAGCTIVFDYHMGDGGIILLFVDFPDFNNDWTVDVAVGFSSLIYNSYDAAFVETAETNPDNTEHRIAMTLNDGKFAISQDGGVVDVASPGTNATPFTDIALSISGTSPSPFYMRSITVYDPQLDAMLPILSAIPESGAIAGTTSLTVTPMAILVAAGSLTGTTAITVSGSAVMVGSGDLAGTSNISLSGSGSMAEGDISGTSSISITPTATLIADGALAGISTITITPTATPLTDPFFANVVLLAGFEGADAATTYSEEKNSRAATFRGNAQLDTGIVLEGSSSLLMDGTGDGIDFADNIDWTLSTANSSKLCIEIKVRSTTATPGNRRFFTHAATANIGWALGLNASHQIEFIWSSDGTSTTTIASSGLTWVVGQEYDICVTKNSSGKFRLYRDGVMVTSSTPANSAIFNASTVLNVGCDSTQGRSWSGSFDEARLTKGEDRYDSDGGYTPHVGTFPRS